MKRILGLLGLLLLGAGLFVGGVLLFSESPMKTVESFAMRHANKLPLAYFGEKLFDKHCSSCHDNSAARGHMQSNGAVVGGTRLQALGAAESCAVCHGPGAEFDAAKVHR